MNQTDTTSIGDVPAETTGASGLRPCWLLKSAKANKLGKHAEGGIHYQILTDSQRQDPSFRIVGNEGGGYFSKEVVAFGNVEACLATHPQEQPFPSKLLQTAFTGRSSNNAGFLAAILRAEGLLTLAPDTEGRHVISGDWAAWKASVLAEQGQPVESEPAGKEEKAGGNEAAASSADEKDPPRRGKK
ncbi:hypothetical protein LQ564_04200 [Massilia sp. G4R7]|uniref:Uncharacterized protein n=1 Tax=Massilia phyllostachyos TaxID=2898585 RepID=A0ABS8Q181_9BURK|nr:hypothetical protein [Massilia phyllostachyos]MCD2515509.1 hypothetical protein [Massilia phyllostachyos]